ncbi:MAG: fatty acid hydroxylase [Candidatus Pacebacteria bacterium]|nr:fatty acid hydroxylase [Candidatus Paceibacterota bacterium]
MNVLFVAEGLGHFLFFVVACSFAEWGLHNYIMHRPFQLLFWRLVYAFKAHALVHHVIYKADYTYHAQEGDDGKKIPMAWWNSFVIIAIGCSLLTWYFWFFGWKWLLLAIPTMFAYYGVYEYIHWCMHLPKARRIEQSWIFFRLNGHHLLHHRYMNKNFNVVLPLADWVLGTLLLRAKTRFAQARGPSVPDVQPLTA